MPIRAHSLQHISPGHHHHHHHHHLQSHSTYHRVTMSDPAITNRLPFLDSSNQFSASKLAKANETLQLLRDTIENVGDAIRVLAQPPFVPLPPPPPPHAPTPSASRGAIAAGRFLKHIEGSKERGDVWLSNDEVLQMLRLFQEDEKTASLYIVISERANEALMRMWVKDQLASLTRS